MAAEGALIAIPAGYEVAGKHVPTAAYWRGLLSRPEEFDADSVWSYTQKLISHDHKPYSLCVFCSKLMAGHNATKLMADKNTPCYYVLAKSADAEDGDDSDIVCYHINAALISMIKDVRAKHAFPLELQFGPN